MPLVSQVILEDFHMGVNFITYHQEAHVKEYVAGKLNAWVVDCHWF